MRHYFMFVLLVLLQFNLLPSLDAALPQSSPPEFFVVIPSYNNEKWCIKNLESVANQTYPHITILYINDCSSDATGPLVEEYIQQHNLSGRCTIVHNTTRKGAMANIYWAIMQCDPKKVVAVVDGDDHLANDQVFDKLAQIYSNSAVWMTYGNYITEPFTRGSYCAAYPKWVCAQQAFRSYTWMGCQLRTFYAKLFHLIKKEDLCWQGQFVPMSSDVALMFPLLEMASRGHIYFVKDLIYVVNTINPISDRKKNLALQRSLDKYLRSRPLYLPLEALF
jgi:glycosyltransferase involved in cell wall biosynthesis